MQNKFTMCMPVNMQDTYVLFVYSRKSRFCNGRIISMDIVINLCLYSRYISADKLVKILVDMAVIPVERK